MKKSWFLPLLLVGVTGFATVHAAEKKPLLQAGDRPNIVIIFNDDMGYADVGCFGSERNKTPHIDKMAAEGRMFTSFYVASSVCSTSRAALMKTHW